MHKPDMHISPIPPRRRRASPLAPRTGRPRTGAWRRRPRAAFPTRRRGNRSSRPRGGVRSAPVSPRWVNRGGGGPYLCWKNRSRSSKPSVCAACPIWSICMPAVDNLKPSSSSCESPSSMPMPVEPLALVRRRGRVGYSSSPSFHPQHPPHAGRHVLERIIHPRMHGDVRGLVDDHVPRLVVALHDHPRFIVISIRSLSGRIAVDVVVDVLPQS